MGLRVKFLIRRAYNFTIGLSPRIEILFRKFYWKNVTIFKRFVNKKPESNNLTDFTKVLDVLKPLILEKNEILIVHSSFGSLAGVNKSPKQVINALLNLLGETGTLAMNSARIFPEEGNIKDILHKEDVPLTTYDLKKSRVWTGALPLWMVRDSRSVISKFPLNPMVAIGNEAQNIVEKNIQHPDSSPCGPNSSWKYCTDRNALVIALGVDLTHNLTIMHVAEENKKDWPVENWYRKRQFRIIDGNINTQIEVKERRPKWGLLHFAERTLRKDLISSGILKFIEIDGFRIEYLRAKSLFEFLNNKNDNGYPYFNFKNQK
jgi:aminoglycoside 3-N-acetyltransferase